MGWEGAGSGMEAFPTNFFGCCHVGKARFFPGFFLRTSMYLIGSGYSLRVDLDIYRETSKAEVIQVSVGRRNDIFI